MVMYAYRTPYRQDGDLINAKTALNEDRSRRYWCPNKECKAALHVNDAKTPYFSADKNTPHTKNCIFSLSIFSEGYEYEEKGFKFQDTVEKIMNSKSNFEHKERKQDKILKKSDENVIDKKPHTVRQMYMAFKIRDYNDTFGDKKVGEMLLDERSEHIYTKFFKGIHLVEAVCNTSHYWYDKDRQEISLRLNSKSLKSKKYTFCLKFAASSLFYEIKNRIFNNITAIYVILGDWEKYNGKEFTYKTVIKSARQIWLLNKKIQ